MIFSLFGAITILVAISGVVPQKDGTEAQWQGTNRGSDMRQGQQQPPYYQYQPYQPYYDYPDYSPPQGPYYPQQPPRPIPSPPPPMPNPNQSPHTCGIPITRSKPGLCPTADDGIQCIWCNDNCRGDYDCSGNSICCKHGCGNTCRRAY